ncbi:MAG: hypothetical protein R3344_09685, partial [Acidobacteriota bacterium]|nr:hypothetical protein [Acidobacteriota bacterium]
LMDRFRFKLEGGAEGDYRWTKWQRYGGLLIATYKSGAHVGIWDLSSGEEINRVKTTRRIPHGVAVSDDDRYAFVSLEGVGGEPGTVEVYELATRERVDSIDVGKQAGGIIFWKGVP